MLANPWVLVVSFVLIVLWVVYFAQMMSLADAEYPGKHDKILWFVVFLLFFFLAPFAFWIWKNFYLFDQRGIQRNFRHDEAAHGVEKAGSL